MSTPTTLVLEIASPITLQAQQTGLAIGTQGVQGIQGGIGIQGTDGLQGAIGAQGVQGTDGLQGATGAQGVQGTDGLQGTDGSQGTTGAQGTDGSQGATGAQGVQGITGDTGAQGTTGVQGVQGITGDTGAQGATGAQGTDGSQGTTGAQGIDGSQGATGVQGITGDTGAQGVQGTQGIQGVQGVLNNTEVASINDQTGTTYTLVAGDAGGVVRCNNESAITLTVPKNSSVAFAIGTVITIEQKGAGQVTVAPVDGDVMINSYDGLKTAGQYAAVSLLKVDTDVWSCYGGICVHETEEECGGTEYTCEDFIQSNTSSYVTVCTNDSATENGEALIAAYTAAKALTPNGAALSSTNRAAVIVPPGNYNLDHLDAPAPAGITITPDAVGDNPVTWYYRLSYIDAAAPTYRSILTEESSFTIGDSTTEIIMSGYNIPSWALEGINIILGTTSGLYNYAGGSGNPSPRDLFGNYTDMGIGNLYPLLLLVPIHQDCTPLTLDTEFVDIIGLTSDRSLQHIYGTPAATNSGVIIQTADDVHISNLTVEILTEVESVNWDDTDSSAYFPSTNLSSTIIENCEFVGGDGNDGESPVLFGMRLAIEYSGTFNYCTGGICSFGSFGTASGTFNYCTGGNSSFGYFGTASGTFTNCTGGDSSFGTDGIASGTFTNCIGDESSFGAEGIPSGTFSFCRVTADTFPTPVASVATITLVAGGTGYTANDELTVVGGTGTAATIKVLTVNAGVILTAEILTVGAYIVEPTNAVAVTGGTGNNDATFNLTWHEGHVYGCIDSTGFIAELNWDD